jgi:hypothetical protein
MRSFPLAFESLDVKYWRGPAGQTTLVRISINAHCY